MNNSQFPKLLFGFQKYPLSVARIGVTSFKHNVQLWKFFPVFPFHHFKQEIDHTHPKTQAIFAIKTDFPRRLVSLVVFCVGIIIQRNRDAISQAGSSKVTEFGPKRRAFFIWPPFEIPSLVFEFLRVEDLESIF